ncbi:hypothetical protein MMC19_006811 [Ptychographa xylographoides]|nr:hypothetical protein [Ptychographa xylographoides]
MSGAGPTITEEAKHAIGMDGSPSAPASRQAMSDARLPLAYRDSCAHLLIPLNRCRFNEYYLPWKCVDERHSYEKCQFNEYTKRVIKQDEIRAAKGGARSN